MDLRLETIQRLFGEQLRQLPFDKERLAERYLSS